MTKERETWIDVWKGLLIFLVVFGHVIGGMRAFVNDRAFVVLNQVYTVVYLFHMPAFFFLAGWLRVRGARNPVSFGSFVGSRARRLLIPYFVWGLVSALVFWALSGWAGLATDGAGHGFYVGMREHPSWWQPLVSLLHAGGWPSGEGFRCNGVLWFLPCFFVVQLMVEIVLRTVHALRISASSRLGCLLLVAMLSWALGWHFCSHQLYGLPWGVDRAPWFLAFEIAGCIMGSSVDLNGKFPSWKLWAGVFVCFAGLAWRYPDLGFYRRSFGWYCVHAGLAMAGVVLSMGFARLAVSRQLLARTLERLGVVSLGIMMIHKFLVLVGQSCYRWIVPGEVWWGAVGLAVLLSIAVSFGTAWCVNVIGRLAPWSFGK